MLSVVRGEPDGVRHGWVESFIPVRDLWLWFYNPSWMRAGVRSFRAVKRYLYILIGLFLLLALNFVYGSVYHVPRDFDIAYIAKNCEAIPSEFRQNISAHIFYDGSVDGGLYIFDSGGSSPDVFEAAFRPIWTEPLCFPVFGCLVPPNFYAGCFP
jgi:hypothetical protein